MIRVNVDCDDPAQAADFARALRAAAHHAPRPELAARWRAVAATVDDGLAVLARLAGGAGEQR